MADSDMNSTPAYRLGALETKVERLLIDVMDLTKKVENGFEKVNDKIDSRFMWLIGVVAVPLNLAVLGLLAHLLGWL